MLGNRKKDGCFCGGTLRHFSVRKQIVSGVSNVDLGSGYVGHIVSPEISLFSLRWDKCATCGLVYNLQDWSVGG